MADKPNYFDPVTLSKVSTLLLRARYVVEGLISGIHTSPYKGFSVEFSEHRQYAPGDEIRHIDWKAYGKFDRYYIKEYEEETNLRCYLLVDASSSMSYHSNGVSKFDYASYLAAALAYVMLNQQDLVGLVTFAESIRTQLPPRSNPRHLRAVIESLEHTTPTGDTGLGRTLHQVASQLKRRGLVIVLSDLLDDPAEVMQGLRHLRYQKHEVLVFHVLDDDEIEFPFTQLTQFEDLEDDLRVITDPRAIKEDYQQQIRQFIKDYERMCRRHAIDYTLFNTRTPLDKGLLKYLAWRGA
ncbi:MAG: DUF58 domain-containing protein [Nitrospinae bacterium]|nr:DUF58 domain-containing protein [Nitrospinota bacterium]